MTCLFLSACGEKSPAPSGPLVHEAYLWQDPQRPGVAAALATARGKLSAIAILAAEGSAREGKLVFREVKNLPIGPDIAHVIRLGQSTIEQVWSPESREMIARQVARLAAARPREIQIDFDCPASRLGDYKELLLALRASAGPVPLVFTSLPNWLDARSFADLARAFPRFVLQVHSLDLPSKPGESVILCDPDAAHRAVAKASALGVEFRVALPTYGSEVLFDSNGKVLDVVSEDSSRVPAAAIASRQRVFADPEVMSTLVRDWTANRPRGLTGICWYRLPVEGNRRNWTWATFAAAMEGTARTGIVEVHAAPGSGGAFNVTLVNPSDAHAPMPEKIFLPAGTLAADATRPYHPSSGAAPVFLRDSADPIWPYLAPGEGVVVGWFRHPNPPSKLSPNPRP
ncbi:MAG: DUF3142 domain-containing protein [Verrucomicrobiales bacterium]